LKIDKTKDERIRKIVEGLFESEVMRSLTTLALFEKTGFLTKNGQALASMGLKKMAEKGMDFPWESQWEINKDSLHSSRKEETK